MDRVMLAKTLVKIARSLVGGHDLAVGDILEASWGYDQTNVNFYEVREVTGSSVKIVEIGKKRVGLDGVVPDPKVRSSTLLTKRVSKDGMVKIHSSASAWKWNGRPSYITPAGMGH